MKSVLKRRIGLSDESALRPTVREVIEAVLDQAEGMMQTVIIGVIKSRGKSADIMNTGSFTPIQLALDVLSAQQLMVQRNFAVHLRGYMYGGVRVGAVEPLVKFEDLGMLDDFQLDESIEVARAQQEVSMSVEQPLKVLDALVSTLLGWVTINPHINPLRPEVFVRALRSAISDVVLDDGQREALITPIAGHLGTELRNLYTQTSEWLRSTGVEPAALTAAAAVSVGSTTGSGAAPAPGALAKSLLTLDKLRKLLAGEFDGGASMMGKDFLHTVPASFQALQDMKQVEAMIERLQKKAADQPQEARDQAALARELRQSRNLGKHLGQEVVRLMVESLTQDERLLRPVRNVLGQLEPLLLRLAEGDPRFFGDKQHPARKFLDRVTSRSLGFGDEANEGFAEFITSMHNAVTALLSKPSDALTRFTLVLDRLEGIWGGLDRVAKTRREEAAKALLHAEQRNLLAQKLSEQFRLFMADKEVPASVLMFVTGPWAQVVAENQLKAPAGVNDPQGYEGLVEELAWSVQPRVARRNLGRLVEVIPAMLSKMREGLASVQFPMDRIGEFFDELITIHEEALETAQRLARMRSDSHSDGGTILPVHSATPALDEPPPSFADSLQREGEYWFADKEAAEAGFLEEDSALPVDVSGTQGTDEDLPAANVPPKELNLGAWAELMVEGNWVRAQLSWASPHRTLFMFVTPNGTAHSMTRRTMDRLRTQGLIKVVSDGEVVQQALDKVAQQALRNTLDGGDAQTLPDDEAPGPATQPLV